MAFRIGEILLLALLQCLTFQDVLSDINVCEEGLSTLPTGAFPISESCEDVCKSTGDPHFNTFDCMKYEYHGKCYYTLVKTDRVEIIAKFERLPLPEKVSVTVDIEIIYENWRIKLDKRFRVLINGSAQAGPNIGLPFGNVQRFCKATIVKMDIGLTVYWRFPYIAMVVVEPSAASTLNGTLSGLCGNNNVVKYDDFTMRDGNLTSDVVELGDSWRTDSTCSLCDDCENTICTVNHQNSERAAERCDLFRNGSMPVCGVGNYSQLMYKKCVDILCATLPEITRLCQLIRIYIGTCVTEGVVVEVHLNGICHDGCYKDGITLPYHPYDSVWTNNNCTEQCSCTKEAGINCEDIQCHVHATCNTSDVGEQSCICTPPYVGNGIDCKYNPCHPVLSRCKNRGKCVPRENDYICRCPEDTMGKHCEKVCRSCIAKGEPHYKSLDRKKFNFQGVCEYIFVKNCAGTEPEFQVVVYNEASSTRRKVPRTRAVIITIGGEEIIFGQGIQSVYINNGIVLQFPIYRPKYRIKIRGRRVILITDEFRAIWDGRTTLRVIVCDSSLNNLCGLCGNGNGDKTDDFKTPNGTLMTRRNINAWAYSWAVNPSKCDPCEDCMTEDPCIAGAPNATEATELCSVITDTSGVFKNCHDRLDPEDYYADCRFDWCAEKSIDDLCENIGDYALDCQNAGATLIGDWRAIRTECSPKCPANSTFELCPSGCQPSCSENQDNKTCTAFCNEECVCDKGFKLEGTECIPEDDCGCVDEYGSYHAPDTWWLNYDCTVNCTCGYTGSFACVKIACDEHASCITAGGGEPTCSCNSPYKGDGVHCTTDPCNPSPCVNGGICVNAPTMRGYLCRCPENTAGPICADKLLMCRAWGDPHYTTYDGDKIHFHGDCKYILTTHCNNAVPAFKVVVNNVKRSSTSTVSITREVTVVVNGQTVFLGGSRGVVSVNNIDVTIHSSLHYPRFTISRTGRNVVVKTGFDLVVEWDWRSRVTVSIPDRFGGNLCGLCGNGNGVKGDDLVDPANNTVSNINTWGHSWANSTDNCAVCTDCPTENDCDTKGTAIKTAAKQRCRIIIEAISTWPTGKKKRSLKNTFSDILSRFKRLVQAKTEPIVPKLVCEHDTLRLTCKLGEVISISSAIYGRHKRDDDPCPHRSISNYNCTAKRSLIEVQQRCNGKRECRVRAKNSVFGDPCRGTYKYLEVMYSCKRATGRVTATVCEHDQLILQCDFGQRISISSALYGRKRADICRRGLNRPLTCAASTSLVRVKRTCEGKRTCSVRAKNNLFGDPCYGTFKYLEVDYTCVNDDIAPFDLCHGTLSPSAYYDACIFDWCAMNPGQPRDAKEQLCSNIAAYSEACQARGIEIGNWRERAGCELDCPAHSSYTVCVGYQRSCTNAAEANSTYPVFGGEDCVCEDNYAKENNACIPVENCGCVDEFGIYFPLGQTCGDPKKICNKEEGVVGCHYIE